MSSEMIIKKLINYKITVNKVLKVDLWFIIPFLPEF